LYRKNGIFYFIVFGQSSVPCDKVAERGRGKKRRLKMGHGHGKKALIQQIVIKFNQQLGIISNKDKDRKKDS